MSTYSTYGHLFGEMPYIPIIKVKDWDIKIPDNFYTTGSGASNESAGTTGEREALFAKIEPWLKLFFTHTLAKLKAADSNVVTIQDLAFILDLCQNVSAYYSGLEVLYFTIDAKSAFKLEVIEYIIQGYSPADAQKKALESLKAGKFASGEPLLVKITNMSPELKKELNDVPNASEGNIFPGQATDDEGQAPAITKRNNTLIVAGLLILILTAK